MLKDKIFTVSELTQDIKVALENTFGEVWVEGEISNFKAHPSGHFYFSLKDQDSLLAAVMFARANNNIKFKLEDGLRVICFGRITVYKQRGQYQLIVEKVEPKGVGAQQLAFEQLKSKLYKEGLFDPAHKRLLPLMPFRIGIITSATGAAVRDILEILKKGAPCVDVIIRSARVQGEGAAGEISQAVAEFNEYGQIDCLIISRGGGSTEDLWAFNEEIVARAIYNSKIPVISAVGHQINTTLSDLAADVFVETPSAAAKIIVDKKNALLSALEGMRYELNASACDILNRLQRSLLSLRHMLKSPRDRLLEKEQLLDELSAGLNTNAAHTLKFSRERFLNLTGRLQALSPLAILSRGYSLSMVMPEGAIIKDAAKIKAGDLVKTVLEKGAFISSVREVIER